MNIKNLRNDLSFQGMSKKFLHQENNFELYLQGIWQLEKAEEDFPGNGIIYAQLIGEIMIIIIFFYYSDIFTISTTLMTNFSWLFCPLLYSISKYSTLHYSLNFNLFINCFLFLLGLHHRWEDSFNFLSDGFCASSVFFFHCIFTVSKLIFHKYCFHHGCYVI